eukprot:3935777-Rhodomonas_salina.2
MDAMLLFMGAVLPVTGTILRFPGADVAFSLFRGNDAVSAVKNHLRCPWRMANVSHSGALRSLDSDGRDRRTTQYKSTRGVVPRKAARDRAAGAGGRLGGAPELRGAAGAIAICQRLCYALSGTELAYGAIARCYALSGTELVYGAIAICIRLCYALSGTELAYGDRAWCARAGASS